MAIEAIRARIVAGDYEPGARLKERDICSELAVSRTPVREALRQLAAEGLVTIEPRRGAVVTDISADEAHEIYSLGAVLESYAAKLAATRASAGDLEALSVLVGEMKATLSVMDQSARARYMTLDSQFHGEILRLAGSRHLTTVLKQTVRVPVLVKAFHHYSDDDLQQSLNQHRAILAALRAREPDWAETAMRAHVLSARSALFPAVRSGESGD